MTQLIVTMEFPAFLHRSMLKARGASGSAEIPRGVFSTQVTFIGSIGTLTDLQRRQWLQEVRDLGAGKSSGIIRFTRRSETIPLSTCAA